MTVPTQVIKRTGEIVPFNSERITNAIYRAAVAVGGRDRATAERVSAQVVALLARNHPLDDIPTVEEIQDTVEKVLIENGHARVAKAYILYRDERSRRRLERARRASLPSETIPWAKIWHILDWAVDHGVHTMAGLNARIERNEYADIVHETEQAYREDLENAAELIAERLNEIRMVIISGPSSSGKTTTTIKIAQHLGRMKKKLVTLNLDHYFFDLALHPKDEFGDYDFETPQALDLELINSHLKQLVAGEEVRIPHYSFKTGTRTDEATPMRLGKNEILLIDSLHGLYPAMTGDIPDELKFRLYLEPLLQIKDYEGVYVRWTDLRLMRRMLRDASHRAYDPRQTLEHWHYVRSSEMRNILPQINSADYIINSGLPYELPILRARLLDSFKGWVDDYRDNPLRKDAFIRAERTCKMLEQVTPVTDESAIPSDSLLREFIGGSTLKY